MQKVYVFIVCILLMACHRSQFASQSVPVSHREESQLQSLTAPEEKNGVEEETMAAAAGTAETADHANVEPEQNLRLSVVEPTLQSPYQASHPTPNLSSSKLPSSKSVNTAKPVGKVKAMLQARKAMRQWQDAPAGGKTSGLAITSFILALLSLPLLFVPQVGVLISLLTMVGAIITGFIAKGKINKSGGALKGKGWATAGWILGVVELLLLILLIAAAASIASSN